MTELEIEGRPFTFTRDGTVRDRPVFVCAHGAGAPLDSAFMRHVADGLVARDVCVVRFHFPYMEATVREDKRRGPDPKKRLLATYERVLEEVERLPGHGPIFIGGKSMGGRIASMLLAEGRAPGVAGAIYLGYPLHPPGQPEKLRADHLASVGVPQLYVSGDRDKLGDAGLLRRTVERIPDATLLFVPGDHSLAPSRKDPFRDSDRWLDAIASFIATPARGRSATKKTATKKTATKKTATKKTATKKTATKKTAAKKTASTRAGESTC